MGEGLGRRGMEMCDLLPYELKSKVHFSVVSREISFAVICTAFYMLESVYLTFSSYLFVSNSLHMIDAVL